MDAKAVEGSRMSISRLIVLTTPAFAVLLGAASPQVPQGRVYVLHSQSSGGCPSLDWHIVREANNVLAGMIAWDDMKAMARAAGIIDRNSQTFTMTAVEIGGQARTIKVDGTINNNGTVIANIKGPNVICNSVVVRAFLFPPSSDKRR
jgi:hypothetical protein